MRTLLTVILSLTIAAPAVAATDTERRCILEAAQRLPSIPGLEITKSGAEQLRKDSPNEPPTALVTIDYKAAGLVERAQFMCVDRAPVRMTIMRMD